MNKKFFKRVFSLCLTIAIISLVGCSTGSKATDNGFINTDTYEGTTYWEDKNLNNITNVKIEREIVNDDDIIKAQSFSELSKKEIKKIEKLKKAIDNYFIENYNIDFSKKLDQQEVTFFSSFALANSMIMGYVDPKDSNTIHLNETLHSTYQELFETTYVHETLHQLGFKDDSCETQYIVEGIVDAYTDLILTSSNQEAQLTDLYFEARQLGYQMIAADKNIPNVFINKDSIKDYMNDALVSYNQKFVHHDDLAGYLNTLLEAINSINSGMAYSENQYWYILDAQSIVQKFCQAKNCDESTIDYIRKHYLVEDFENLKVIDNGDGSYTIN